MRCLDPQAASTQAGSAGLSPQESLPKEGVVGGAGRQLPDIRDGAPGAKRIVSPEHPGSLTSDFFFFLILFIYLWLRWVFVSVRGLSL